MIKYYNTILKQCIDDIPAAERAELEMYQDISDKIDATLKSRNLTCKDLSRMMGKPLYVVKGWLTGTHHFSIKTISAISAALNQPLMRVN